MVKSTSSSFFTEWHECTGDAAPGTGNSNRGRIILTPLKPSFFYNHQSPDMNTWSNSTWLLAVCFKSLSLSSKACIIYNTIINLHFAFWWWYFLNHKMQDNVFQNTIICNNHNHVLYSVSLSPRNRKILYVSFRFWVCWSPSHSQLHNCLHTPDPELTSFRVLAAH